MCGIAGKISFGSVQQEDLGVLKNMADAISHRGPDAEGFFLDENVGFAHRRLSIIDTSVLANQPMTDESGSIVVVFNGEIYNYQEIREKLKQKYCFRTHHSDTETLVYAFKEWGIEFLQKLNGFFALAIYDKVNRTIFLVRDRLGKKPLYYWANGSDFYFASEAKALFAVKKIQKRINHESLYHYLTFLTVPAPSTFFRDVFKLEPGFFLKITPSRVEKKCYWNISDYLNCPIDDDFQLAHQKTRLLLERSMEYRNIADVGVAIALSGGIDSSLNLAFSKKSNPSISAINLAFSRTSEYDEAKAARQLADEFHVDFESENFDENVFSEAINEYGNLQLDAPAGDINTALVYHLAKICKNKGCKVLLVGEGGDEIGGYPIYEKMAKEFPFLKILGKFHRFFPCLPNFVNEKISFFYNSNLISRRHIHGFSEFQKKGFWKKDLFDSYEIFHNLMSEVREDLTDSFLRKILNVEYKLRLPELILSRIDYPTMAASVEARSPFMDHELIEYSAGLNWGVKMRNGPKSILKAIAKDVLPDWLLNKPKVGFGMLLTPFLRQTMPIWFNNQLVKNECILEDYISKDFFSNLEIANSVSGNLGYRMWLLFSLELWLKANELNG